MGKIGKRFGDGFEAVVKRIKDATDTRTQVQLAEVLGIRQSSISDAKRRDSVPADWFLTLFSDMGLNPDWLGYGVGPRVIKTKEGYQSFDEPALSHAVREDSSAYGNQIASSIVVACFSEGGGSYDEVDKWKPISAGKLAIPKSYDRESLLVIKIDGSGMEPLVRRGAYVGIDRDQTSVLSGEIYGILVPLEGLVIRRVFLEGDNSRIVLKAENSTIPDQSCSISEFKNRVIGRVIWMMQEM